MFPHDHPFMDEEAELMGPEAKEMEKKLSEVIQSPYVTESTDVLIGEHIHAYIFVYDYSNKRTFDAMFCMIDTIKEIEAAKKKGGGLQGGNKKEKKTDQQTVLFPKMIVIGNKKDLTKNKNAGSLKKEDIVKLQQTKITEVSALTNEGLAQAFKSLIVQLDNDPEHTAQ